MKTPEQMTRGELMDFATEQTVAKWGEAERAGARQQAERASDESLRWTYAEATGQAFVAQARQVRRGARGCLDAGVS